MLDDTSGLISICIPVLNEEKSIRQAYDRVIGVFKGMQHFNYEIIFTDNHSSDKTFEIISSICATDKHVKVARFSSNVGYQRSILTGYMLSKGQAVVQLDCDLQDPPELIPRMIELWRSGADVVYGIRASRKEGRLITFLRKFFYRLLDFLSEQHLPHDVGDFRLLDRKIIDVLLQVDDKSPYLRGIIASMGFNQIGIKYERDERTAGETKFNPRSLLNLAIDAIVAHSTLPLQLSSYLGFFISIISFFIGTAYLVAKFAVGTSWPAGFATLALLMFLNMALTCFLFGIIGLYLSRVFKQVKGYPVSIIEKSVNIERLEKSVLSKILDCS